MLASKPVSGYYRRPTLQNPALHRTQALVSIKNALFMCFCLLRTWNWLFFDFTNIISVLEHSITFGKDEVLGENTTLYQRYFLQ